MIRMFIISLLLLVLSACAATKSVMFESGIRFQVMNPYVEIKYDFEHGRIMQARERVLALEKEHKDYAVAHSYLRKTIEPARRRIFVHYLRTAKRAEQQRRWAAAMEAYAEAKSVTIKPDLMEKKRSAMEFKLRQLRLDRLLRLRRGEDDMWLGNLPSYSAPKGVSANDEVYLRQREIYHERLEDRADEAYSEAKSYLRNGQPEIAYVEIESHLRLQPDSGRGKRLLAEIRKAVPSQLKIANNIFTRKQSTRQASSDAVTAEQIQQAIRQENLVEARQLAQQYRRSGANDADQLISQLQKKIESRASTLFSKGSTAFRKERLDEAIGYWSKSVRLMPDQAEYVEALHRARQLKERLTLLREQKESDPVPDEE